MATVDWVHSSNRIDFSRKPRGFDQAEVSNDKLPLGAYQLGLLNRLVFEKSRLRRSQIEVIGLLPIGKIRAHYDPS
jgi:hypothetical protein